MSITIAAVQLNPLIRNVAQNGLKAMEMVERAVKQANKKPDVIVFPEMSITGYNYRSRDDVMPIIRKDESLTFAKSISRHWGCHTLIGYPELFEDHVYNSAMVLDPSGNETFNYRKTHLFETDKVWGCSESAKGFEMFDLQIKGINLKSTIGICMDLNPYEFKAPFDAYEFSRFANSHNSQLTFVMSNWLHSKWDPNWKEVPKSIKDSYAHGSAEVDMDTVMYWLNRFKPLYEEVKGYNQNVVVVNRCGIEGELLFAGSSNIWGVAKGDDNIKVLGCLSEFNEGVLIRDVVVS